MATLILEQAYRAHDRRLISLFENVAEEEMVAFFNRTTSHEQNPFTLGIIWQDIWDLCAFRAGKKFDVFPPPQEWGDVIGIDLIHDVFPIYVPPELADLGDNRILGKMFARLKGESFLENPEGLEFTRNILPGQSGWMMMHLDEKEFDGKGESATLTAALTASYFKHMFTEASQISTDKVVDSMILGTVYQSPLDLQPTYPFARLVQRPILISPEPLNMAHRPSVPFVSSF